MPWIEIGDKQWNNPARVLMKFMARKGHSMRDLKGFMFTTDIWNDKKLTELLTFIMDNGQRYTFHSLRGGFFSTLRIAGANKDIVKVLARAKPTELNEVYLGIDECDGLCQLIDNFKKVWQVNKELIA